MIWEDVLSLVHNDCAVLRSLAAHHRSARRWWVLAGSPCQGFSSRGAGRGLLDPRSALLLVAVVIISNLQAFVEGDLFWLIENVVSMDPHWQDTISELLGVRPVEFDAGLLVACRRPRLFWSNIPGLLAPPRVTLDFTAVLDPGWMPLQDLDPVFATTGPRDRWPTFLRPFRPGAGPPGQEGDFWRYGLYAYGPSHLVVRDDLDDASVRDLVARLRSLQAHRHNAPEGQRRALRDFMHLETQLSLVRPLNGHERARACGLAAEARPLDELPQQSSAADWNEALAVGNVMAPAAVAHLLAAVVAEPSHRQLARPLQHRSVSAALDAVHLNVSDLPPATSAALGLESSSSGARRRGRASIPAEPQTQ